MDTSAMSRVIPPSDVFTPRTAASAPDSENPPEKTVVQVKDTEAMALNERGREAAQQQQADANPEHKKRYELQERIYVYSVSDAKTGDKVVQFPSEQAVKLRAYLAAEAAKGQRKQEAQKEGLDIVA
jgi:uncharacterized FlaG/YvyC family protein